MKLFMERSRRPGTTRKLAGGAEHAAQTRGVVRERRVPPAQLNERDEVDDEEEKRRPSLNQTATTPP